MLTTLLELISALAIVVAVIQLTREVRSSSVQSLFYLHQYLAQDTFSHARKVVRTQLCNKPYADWTGEDRDAANRVCASYDQAGLLMGTGVIPKRVKRLFLASSWGNSICDQYESLVPFLDDQQTPTLTGREFFRHFSWLYLEAQGIHRSGVPADAH